MNTPIQAIDLDGLEKEEVISAAKWAGKEIAELGNETAEGIKLRATNPKAAAGGMWQSVKNRARDVGTIGGTRFEIVRAQATSDEADINHGAFDAAARRIATRIVKEGTATAVLTGTGAAAIPVLNAAKVRPVVLAVRAVTAKMSPTHLASRIGNNSRFGKGQVNTIFIDERRVAKDLADVASGDVIKLDGNSITKTGGTY